MNTKPAKTFIVIGLTLLTLAADVVSAKSDAQPVTMVWNFSPNAAVTNYNVYYGVASGDYTNEIVVGNYSSATIAGLVPGVSYYFAVTAEDTNGMESAYSNEIDYQVPVSTTVPVIASQPTNMQVLAGSNALFSVTANGGQPLSYQWYFNGAALIGETNDSLTVADVHFRETGNYAVMVSNSFGSVLSSYAKLTLAWLPRIASQPASQSVESGCNATFTVGASGTAPLSYQWFNNGAPLVSATNSSLEMPDVQSPELGNYRVVVNNAFGAVTSAVAVLALGSPPTTEPCFVKRFSQGGVRLNASVLTSNDTVALYDSLTVISVSSTSSNGGAVTLQNHWIYYAPPAGAPAVDSFTYIVSDGHCGTAEGTVTVTPDAMNPQPMHFSISPVGDGSVQLSFDGVPGEIYQLQYKENLTATRWLPLINQETDDFGVFRFTAWPAPDIQALFYRAGTTSPAPMTQAAP